VRIAPRLIVGKNRCLATLRRHVSETFAEAALAKLLGAAKELNRIVCAIGRNASLHGAVVLVAERQNVGPHGLSLAFHRRWPGSTAPTMLRVMHKNGRAEATALTRSSHLELHHFLYFERLWQLPCQPKAFPLQSYADAENPTLCRPTRTIRP
jgi:hypothetical protein